MNLWNWIAELVGLPTIESSATEIAHRCLPQVWQRVRQNIVPMSLSQARGYLRARSLLVIDQEIATASAQDKTIAGYDQSELTDLVMERVVKLGLQETLESSRRRPVARRRAA